MGDAVVGVIDEAAPDAMSPEGSREELDPATALKNDLRESRATGTSSPTPGSKVKANLETRVQNLDVGDYIFQVGVPTEVTEIRTASANGTSRKGCRAASWCAWT